MIADAVAFHIDQPVVFRPVRRIDHGPVGNSSIRLVIAICAR
jgi:hypothetical protein